VCRHECLLERGERGGQPVSDTQGDDAQMIHMAPADEGDVVMTRRQQTVAGLSKAVRDPVRAAG
jgi:hypothetical protein